AASQRALSAQLCWRNWQSREVTKHDGLVPANHAVVQAILARRQSASSLRLLLRYPLAFMWKYGLGLKAPTSGSEELTLDALATGDLIHQVLQVALDRLEAQGGLLRATDENLDGAVKAATVEVAERWTAERPTPPRIIWRRTLEDAEATA